MWKSTTRWSGMHQTVPFHGMPRPTGPWASSKALHPTAHLVIGKDCAALEPYQLFVTVNGDEPRVNATHALVQP